VHAAQAQWYAPCAPGASGQQSPLTHARLSQAEACGRRASPDAAARRSEQSGTACSGGARAAQAPKPGCAPPAAARRAVSFCPRLHLSPARGGRARWPSTAAHWSVPYVCSLARARRAAAAPGGQGAALGWSIPSSLLWSVPSTRARRAAGATRWPRCCTARTTTCCGCSATSASSSPTCSTPARPRACCACRPSASRTCSTASATSRRARGLDGRKSGWCLQRCQQVLSSVCRSCVLGLQLCVQSHQRIRQECAGCPPHMCAVSSV